MTNITIMIEKLISPESPFTELFSLLKHYDNESGLPTLAYASDELKVIYKHIDNALDVLLRGLNGMGHLIGTISQSKKTCDELKQLGFFISAISNLTAALNDLRSDTDYALKERGVGNY